MQSRRWRAPNTSILRLLSLAGFSAPISVSIAIEAVIPRWPTPSTQVEHPQQSASTLLHALGETQNNRVYLSRQQRGSRTTGCCQLRGRLIHRNAGACASALKTQRRALLPASEFCTCAASLKSAIAAVAPLLPHWLTGRMAIQLPPTRPLCLLCFLCRWALRNVWREGDVLHMM